MQATEQELPVNWKIFVESFLEGYHIRSTHPETFLPYGFDNLNLIDLFGRDVGREFRRVVAHPQEVAWRRVLPFEITREQPTGGVGRIDRARLAWALRSN